MRREKPTVGDEVKNVLWYVEEILWDLCRSSPASSAAAFERAYGEPLGASPMPLRIHSWVGGDMDGNPNVTPEVARGRDPGLSRARAQRLLAAVRELGWGALAIDAGT